jgi:arginine-tRNA-protein transferase
MKWKPDSESSIPPLVQYSPDMANTCCPQYTIRLDALRFDPGKNKKMRYLINRWKRYIMEGVKPGDVVLDGGKTGGKDKESKKSRYDERHLAATDQLIPNASTAISQKVRHTTISKNFIPQSTTMRLQLECNQQCGMKSRWYLRQLRFALYERYQETIHHDGPGQNHMSGFDRFLCQNPFGVSLLDSGQYRILLHAEYAYRLRQKQRILYPTPDNVPPDLPRHYGCFHQRELTHVGTFQLAEQ